MFCVAVLKVKLKVQFEFDQCQIHPVIYFVGVSIGALLPLIRKVSFKIIKAKHAWATDGDTVGKITVEPKTPAKTAILESLNIYPVPMSPKGMDHVIRDPSEFESVRDMLFPLVINDGFFLI